MSGCWCGDGGPGCYCWTPGTTTCGATNADGRRCELPEHDSGEHAHRVSERVTIRWSYDARARVVTVNGGDATVIVREAER